MEPKPSTSAAGPNQPIRAPVVGAPEVGPRLRELSWAPAARRRSLEELFVAVDSFAESSVLWYERNARTMRKRSRALRIAAIAFGALGALIPLIATAAKSSDWSPWGYVAAAIAAACVAADRFFGASSSWIRFITSSLKLRTFLLQERFEWALVSANMQSGAEPPSIELTLEAIQRMGRFVGRVQAEILSETEVWAKEFQSALADLERVLQAQREAERPSALQVTLEHSEDVEEVRLVVDGAPGPKVAGASCSIPRVPAGQHVVEAHGRRGDRFVGDSKIVSVPPGEIVNVTLDLS